MIPLSEETPSVDRDVQGILRTAWGPVSEGTPREDPSRCPRDPLDSMGQLCERNMKGGSQDVQRIIQTAV